MQIDLEMNKIRFSRYLCLALNGKGKPLLMYLERNGFFEAPCSAGHHLNVDGGLCEHSLMVMEFALILSTLYRLPFSTSSIIITALLHDVHKMFLYEKKKGVWQCKSANAKGKISKSHSSVKLHGQWSVQILQGFISLTKMEREMILWHMGPYTDYYDHHKVGDFLDWSSDKSNINKHAALFLYFCDHFSTMFLED